MLFWFLIICWLVMIITTIVGVYNIAKLKMEFIEKSVYILPVVVLFCAGSYCFYRLIVGSV